MLSMSLHLEMSPTLPGHVILLAPHAWPGARQALITLTETPPKQTGLTYSHGGVCGVSLLWDRP
jgi:hypothetical protein